MKSYRLITLILLVFFIALSCDENNLLNENPPHFISGTNLYTSVEGFESSLNGLYGMVRYERASARSPYAGRGGNAMYAIFATAGTDNLFANFAGDGFYWSDLFRNYGSAVTPENQYVRRYWTLLYKYINQANTIANKAEEVELNWTEEKKNSIIGQARLLRAWAYRHLTYLWGDVPLNLEGEGQGGLIDWERTPIQEVRQQMEKDLLFAEQYLPDVPSNDHKVTRVLAQHYLAELYLELEDYSAAVEKAQIAIENPNYSLITSRYGIEESNPGTPFTDMFIDGNSKRSEGNTEALWVWENDPYLEGNYDNLMRRTYQTFWDRIQVDGVSPFEISAKRGGRGLGRVTPTRWAWSIYESQDDRISEYAWRFYGIIDNQAPPGYTLGDTLYLDTTQVEGKQKVNWPSITKWDGYHPDNVNSSPGYTDQIYVRLAETYLLLAEAQLKNGNPTAAAATINVLRKRSNASSISATDVDIDFILDERSRELITEEHRKYTLLRNNKWIERTREYNPTANITERDKLLPIPQSVIDANNEIQMEQNPSY